MICCLAFSVLKPYIDAAAEQLAVAAAPSLGKLAAGGGG